MKTMPLILVLILTCHASFSFGQGSAFTYQGRLNDGDSPATGSYDLQFTLFATNRSGAAVAGPVTNMAVAVTNGLFTTTVDFGDVFTGVGYWLELAVSTNTLNAFSTLAPRQRLMPVPYAGFANAASNLLGRVPTAQLSGTIPATNVTGILPLALFPGGVVTNCLNIELFSNNIAIVNGLRFQFSNSLTAGLQESVNLLTSTPYLFGSNVTTISLNLQANTIYDLYQPLVWSNFNYYLKGAGAHSSWLRWAGATNWTTVDGMVTNPAGNAMIVLAGRHNDGYGTFYDIGDCRVDGIGFTTRTNFPLILLVAGGERNFINYNVFAGAEGLTGVDPQEPLAVVGCVVAGISGNQIDHNSFYDVADGCFIPQAFTPLLNADGLLSFCGNEGYVVGAGNWAGNIFPSTNILSAGALLILSEANQSSIFDNHVTVGNTVVFNAYDNGNVPFGEVYCRHNALEAGTGIYYAAYIGFTNSFMRIEGTDGTTAFQTVSPVDFHPTGGSNNATVVTFSSAKTEIDFGSSIGLVASKTGISSAKFTGSGAGLTGLNAAELTGTVPTASLPGITTNVSNGGITFYITNGLIMRVSTP